MFTAESGALIWNDDRIMEKYITVPNMVIFVSKDACRFAWNL